MNIYAARDLARAGTGIVIREHKGSEVTGARENRAPLPAEPIKASIRAVARLASTVFDVPLREIVGPSLKHPYVHARQAVMRVAFAWGYSTKQIGIVLGRDHTTVSHGLTSARDRIGDDPDYAEKVRAIEALLIPPVAPRDPNLFGRNRHSPSLRGFAPEMKAAIVADYLSGLPTATIAATYGVSRSYPARLAKREGHRTRREIRYGSTLECAR